MTRTILIITAVFIISILAGCTEQSRTQSATNKSLSTVEGLSEYLRQLPAVKSVQPWQNQYAPGIVMITDHYEIRTTLLDPLMLRQVPAFMESAYDAYQSQFPEPIETQTRFVTYLFADRSQWEDFTKSFAAPNTDMYLKIRKGAYYLNGASVAYNIGRTRTFAALAHEGWHQFNSRHFAYRLPSWLDEGIATLFEASQYSNGALVFQPDRNLGRLQSLKKAIQQRKMLPVAELIRLNPGQLVDDTDAVKAFYAQSYALVRFLREDDYGKRLARYHNLLLGGLRGNWPLDARTARIAADRNIPLTTAYNINVSPKLFALYIGGNLEQIDNEYNAFCQKNVYHIRPGD